MVDNNFLSCKHHYNLYSRLLNLYFVERIYIYWIHIAMSESINPEEKQRSSRPNKALPEEDVEQQGESDVVQETTTEPETSPSTNEGDKAKGLATVESDPIEVSESASAEKEVAVEKTVDSNSQKDKEDEEEDEEEEDDEEEEESEDSEEEDIRVRRRRVWLGDSSSGGYDWDYNAATRASIVGYETPRLYRRPKLSPLLLASVRYLLGHAAPY